jgi:hypothetical protein
VVDFVLARQEPEGVDTDDPSEFAVVIEVGGEDDVAVVVVGVGGGVVFDPERCEVAIDQRGRAMVVQPLEHQRVSVL